MGFMIIDASEPVQMPYVKTYDHAQPRAQQNGAPPPLCLMLDQARCQ